ncbi:MAG: DUF962 domain-containing protein [Cyanobacteria bacterium]|nr:DUF962 domain-containing protein [Cyanobacteriota bacterium]
MNPSLKSHLKYYRSQHKTLGCKLTHLVGVPLIALSIPMFLFNWKRGAALFSFGWFLQLLGHLVFEKNRPILFSRHRHALTLISALVYVTQEWVDTLKSVGVELHESGNGKRLPALTSTDNGGD